jgi:hypothetical protein
MIYKMMREIARIGLSQPYRLDDSVRLLTAFLREQRDAEQCEWSAEQWLYLLGGWTEDAAGRRVRLQHFIESTDLLLSERV